jgi:ribonucleoside-triphosphate reductase
MNFHVSYHAEFDALMARLQATYGHELFDLDGIGKQTDMNAFAKAFFSPKSSTTADVSVDANANVESRDVIAYNFEMPKPFFRYNSYYLLWKMLHKLYGLQRANQIIEMQLTGDIYINDFGDVGRPYCMNYSTYDILLEGLPMVTKITCSPPKYLYSFKSQLEQFVVIAGNSTLGATGLADIFLVMSYYVKNLLTRKADAGFRFQTEADCWKYVKENLLSFIYTINQPMRGNQSPFTNVSVFDDAFLQELAPSYMFPDGSTPDIEVVKQLQSIFLDVMNEELRRTPITFPVTTACFSVDDEDNIQDEAFAELIAEKNQEFGFINIYCGTTSTLSSCCRLRSDTKNEYFNSFGAGSTKIGSVGVVTMNLPRLAWKYKDDEAEFFEQLRELVKVCGQINHAKRQIIKSRIECQALPLYSLGFIHLDKQYSTVGVTGINEMSEILGYDILTSEGQTFVLDCLHAINATNDAMQAQYGDPHNCEQVPAENSSIKLASKDDYLGYSMGYQMYSNQFIPLTTKADILDRIKLQGLFDKHFSGGAICHLNIGQRIPNPATIVKLIKTCARQGVVYWALNYNLQRCKLGHMDVGQNDTCSICGSPIVDNFTRVVGFLTNTKNWHHVRRDLDYPQRQFYKDV